jgi:hypothetical protein
MALAYTAPTWTDGSGEGISASNLQAISNCIEGLVQGSDKAVHHVEINSSVITLTYADGTSEDFTAADIKGIASIAKTSSSGLVDTYTITYTDGTTDTFDVSNGEPGTYPEITATASADATSSANPSVEVTKTGDDDAPNFNFAFSGLKGAQGEQGPTGADGQDGQDGVSPEVTITTITGGHRITITDADHPSGQSFDVLDGSGSGDMQASTYDPQGAVATAGGIPDYVSSAISGKADDSDLDAWSTTATVSNGAVTFSGIDDSAGTNGYRLYIDVTSSSTNKNPSREISSISGEGTSNMSITFTTDADNGATAKLRIIK